MYRFGILLTQQSNIMFTIIYRDVFIHSSSYKFSPFDRAGRATKQSVVPSNAWVIMHESYLGRKQINYIHVQQSHANID